MASPLVNQWMRLLGASPEGAAATGASADARVVAWQVSARHSEWVGVVWAQVQAEAGLPAPAIAVNGQDGWSVFFALPAGCSVSEAQGVLRHLITRALRQADVAVSAADAQAWGFTCWPAEGAPGASPEGPPVPRQTAPDRWSAFVAPDLVPVFADTPWLDCAPGEEGQAALLGRLHTASPASWARCRADAQAHAHVQADEPAPPAGGPPTEVDRPSRPTPASGSADEARAFLLRVMNDEQVDLGHRIEAARALLAHG